MPTNISARIAMAAVLAAAILILIGCGPKSPVPYQQLQVQSDEESQGWDVYMYVAVEPGTSDEDVTALLEYFRDVKFADQNRIQIFIWDNPQSALIAAMGDMVASLTVDREAQVDKIEIFRSGQ